MQSFGGPLYGPEVHEDTERTGCLMEHLELQDRSADDSGSYILVGNVYASIGKWIDKAEVRGLMNKKGLVKPPGYSRIEIDGVVHEFVMGDDNHPEAEKIFVKLDQMGSKIRIVKNLRCCED